jgi:translation initiation factor RLI1
MRYYPSSAEKKSYTSEEICMGCGCCVETCPAEARGMKIVEPPESVTKMPDYKSRVLDTVYIRPAGQ